MVVTVSVEKIADMYRIQLPRSPGTFAVRVTTPAAAEAVTPHVVFVLMLAATLVAMTVGVSPLVMAVSIDSSCTHVRCVALAVAVPVKVMVPAAAAPALAATKSQ